MKQMKLQNIIRKSKKALTWTTLECHEDIVGVRIISDPLRRAHTIYLPLDKGTVIDEFSYLHELGHATLCEQVHPVFAANSYFASSTDQEHFFMLAPALQTASDWYVSYWLYEISPEKFRTFLQEKLELVETILASPKPPTVDVFLDSAHTVALGIKYLDAPIYCDDKLKEAVDSFLWAKADSPTKNAFSQLVNTLMSIYTPMRAQLKKDDGYDVWEACPVSDTAAP